MAFIPRYDEPTPGTSGYSWSSEEISSGKTGKHQCAWYAVGRGRELGANWDSLSSLGNAEDFYNNYVPPKGASKSKDNPQLGDIICFNGAVSRTTGKYVPGHVMVIEAIKGDTLVCSDFNGNGGETFGVRSIKIGADLYDNYPFEGYLHLGVSGGGASPDVPPDPQPGGHWEWVEESIETLTPFSIDIRESECGRGVAADQTGSQDEPKAPYQMDGNPDGSRLNERWEPFNMYTYERTETYDQNYNPIWSSWEQKYSGSQTVMLGDQPAYGNGWEMDWGDE